jgi:hypothetical protein
VSRLYRKIIADYAVEAEAWLDWLMVSPILGGRLTF